MSCSTDRPRSSRVALGRSFEARAVEFLKSRKYTIIATHQQVGHKELDIVAEKDGELIFVEVKGSRSNAFGHPAEWVTPRKQARLAAAAELYMLQHGLAGRPCRFDVITISHGELEHYPNAFPVPGN